MSRRDEFSEDPRVLESYPVPERTRLRDELNHGVDKAMRKILPRQAEVIRMVVDEKLTFEQIGEHYGIRRNSAHDRYTRAKEALRKELLKDDLIRELME